MLQNRYGFVPKRYLQPDDYDKQGQNWLAVYLHPVTHQKYYIRMNSHHLSSSGDYAADISVLRQDPDCRRRIGPNHKSIKSAVAALENILAQATKKEE